MLCCHLLYKKIMYVVQHLVHSITQYIMYRSCLVLLHDSDFALS